MKYFVKFTENSKQLKKILCKLSKTCRNLEKNENLTRFYKKDIFMINSSIQFFDTNCSPWMRGPNGRRNKILKTSPFNPIGKWEGEFEGPQNHFFVYISMIYYFFEEEC